MGDFNVSVGDFGVLVGVDIFFLCDPHYCCWWVVFTDQTKNPKGKCGTSRGCVTPKQGFPQDTRSKWDSEALLVGIARKDKDI